MTRVIHVLPGLAVGGTEMALLRLVGSTNGIEHRVITLTSHDALKSEFERLGVRVESLMMTRNPLSWFRVLKLRNLVRKFVPDVVQSWLYAADLALVFAGTGKNVRRIWNIRQSEIRLVRGQSHIYVMQRIAALVSKVVPETIVYCGEAAQLTHQQIGYCRSTVVVIPNGINVNKYQPDEAAGAVIRQELGIADDVFVFGLVGRYDPLKNQQMLLAAFAALAERAESAVLVLAGRGVDDNNIDLVKLIQQHDLRERVQLLGPRTDVPGILAMLDCHVLVSTSEGWPNVLAEAMASEVYCITTPVGDAPTILGDCGTVLNDYEPESLATAMSDVMQMKREIRNSFASLARARVTAEYSLERFGQRYQQLYVEDVGAKS